MLTLYIPVKFCEIKLEYRSVYTVDMGAKTKTLILLYNTSICTSAELTIIVNSNIYSTCGF